MIGQGLTRGRGLSSFVHSAGLAIIPVLFTGCIFNPPEPPIPPGGEEGVIDRTTPERLVRAFAYHQTDPHRDLVEYGRCLHPQYGFFFTPDDAGPIGEEFWTKDQDTQGMQDLFNAALQISVTMAIEDTLDTQPCDQAAPEVLCTTYAVRVDMTLVAPAPRTHEVTTYLVNGRADFVITRDPANPGLYVIREIHDRTNEAARVAGSSGGAGGPAMAAARTASWSAARALGSS